MKKPISKSVVQDLSAVVPSRPPQKELINQTQVPPPELLTLRNAEDPAMSCSTCQFYDSLSQYSNGLRTPTDPLQVCDLYTPKAAQAPQLF